MRFTLDNVASQRETLPNKSRETGAGLPGADLERDRLSESWWVVLLKKGSHNYHQLLVDLQVSNHRTEFLEGYSPVAIPVQDDDGFVHDLL